MLTQEEVRHIAKLAKIKLTAEDEIKFQRELSGILDFFEVLNSAPTEGIAETSQVTGLENQSREDVIEISEIEEALIECTPHKTEDHCVKIPKIM